MARLNSRSGNAQVKGLRDKIRAVQEENASYRASNKAAEFEARVQVRCNPAAMQIDHAACCACMLKTTCCCTADTRAGAQELTAAVARAEAGKVDAQRELHEMQVQASARTAVASSAPREADHEAVAHIIDDLEAHGIGARGATPVHPWQALQRALQPVL